MKTKRLWKRILLWALLLILTAVVAVAGFYTFKGYRIYRDALEECPIPEKVEALRSEASYVPLGELPAIYKDAVIAVEDHRFESHNGVDPIAVLRAVWTNLRTRSLREGGSTITQQLAKNIYFTQEKKLERKIAECFMAWEMEKHLEKDDILELYINNIYYGSGYYCIYDAAVGYFGKEPQALSPYECTLLVGLPNAPSVYDPTRNPELARERQERVLEKMVRFGYLSEEEAEEIKHEKDL